MNDTDKKLQVLSKIAHALNGRNVSWAVGASLLLYLKNKTDHFNDIDLMVCEEDVDCVKEVLLWMGAKTASNPNEQYKTRHFLEFSVDGVDVDVMAGFVIVKDNIEYDCSFRSDQIFEYIQINNETIPLQSLADWKRYYEWMDRPEKVKMID